MLAMTVQDLIWIGDTASLQGTKVGSSLRLGEALVSSDLVVHGRSMTYGWYRPVQFRDSEIQERQSVLSMKYGVPYRSILTGKQARHPSTPSV